MSTRSRYLISLFLALTLILVACGQGNDEPAPASEVPAAAAPLAQEEPTQAPEAEPTEAPAATEVPAAAPTEAAAEEAPAAEEAAPSELVSMVDAYLSAIPEGYMSVGKLDAFKEILATGEAVILDVREEAEYAEGHIEGAINIPIRTLAQNLDKVPMDKPVIVYCASGHRAGMATSSLQMLGYTNVRAFPAGWKGWSEAGEPVSTDAVEATVVEVPEIAPELLAAVDTFLTNIPEGFYMVGTPEKLDEAIAAGAVLVDVREESEFAEGAIANAINIPIRTLAQNLSQIPQDQPVVVYCASGHRAALATAALQAMGYTNVRAFPPGYPAWEAAQGESGDVPTEPAAAEPATDVVAAVDAYLSAIPEGYMNVGTLDAFKEMVASADPLIIDVREESDYAEGHIGGAINIPIRTLAQNLDKIPMDRPVVVYCASGHRAGMATTSLRVLGYENVKAFSGGWKAWSGASEPVSTEAVEAVSGTAPEVDAALLAAVDTFLSNMPEGFYSLGTVELLVEAVDAGAVLVDVREENEYADGHIAGALSLPIRTLAQNLDQIPMDKPVVVYCASGYRAALSTAALQIMGYTNVRAFPPSYGAWEAAGEPVE